MRANSVPKAAFWLAVALPAAAGTAAIIAATAHGAGLTADSTAYISQARAMLLPLGFRFVLVPASGFPPLFPALLALGGIFSGDPASAARWVNALFFGCNIALVAVVLRRIRTGSVWAPIFGGCLVLTAVSLVQIHAMAWSEPSFVCLCLSAMLALDRGLERSSSGWLALAALLSAAAVLDRYAGAALAIAGAAALLAYAPGPRRRRAAEAAMYAAATCLPAAVWLLYQPSGRVLTFQPPAGAYFQSALDTLAEWGSTTIPFRSLPFLLLCAGIGVWLVWKIARAGRSRVSLRAMRIPRMLAIVGYFAGSFLLVNLAARTFADLSLVLDTRLMAPVLVCALVGGCALLDSLVSALAPGIWPRLSLGAFAFLLLRQSAASSWRVVERDQAQGLAFASVAWQESPTLARLQSLPPDLIIYSNGWDAIYILTARPALRLPFVMDHVTRLANGSYQHQMTALANELSQGRAVIVYFDGIVDRPEQPSEQELSEALPLRLIVRETDGAIYR